MAVASVTSTTSGDVITKPDHSKQEEIDKFPNRILSFFTNLLKNFKLPPLPFFPPKKHQAEDELATATSETGHSKSGVVSYPNRDLSSEKLDVVQVRERQPLVVWQGYVIGGVLVLRWAWVMWNRRISSKKPPNHTPPPPPPPPPPADD